MNSCKAAQYAMGMVAAVALLAGCSGMNGGLQSSPPAAGVNPAAGGVNPAGSGVKPGLVNQNGMGGQNRPKGAKYTSLQAPTVHRDTHKSHVSPDLKGAPRILFVSDETTDDVYIFTMPKMTLKGTLTGFNEPQGMCSDKSGNIWITNTGTLQILQYSRTGSLLKSLSDPNGYPVGCAVNKTNGDLAVTNIFNNTGTATVDVFSNATGTPTSYSNPSQTENFFAAYDNSGNLYVDGYGNYGFSLSELSSGSSTMHTINLSGGTIVFPGSVNWTQQTGLIVGDQECNYNGSCLYSVSVSGYSGQITGSTPLTNYNGGACDVDQGTISPIGNYFAGGCISLSSAASTADRWAYPAGGIPTNYSTSVVTPVGAAISNK